MNTAKGIITACTLVTGLAWATSCDKYNYVDELQGLGARVEVLEKELPQLNADLQSLNTLLRTATENGYVTKVEEHNDGSYTLRLNTNEEITIRNGRQGADGRDGKDGKEATLLVGVGQADDGQWYWILNGEWITDGNGQKIRAGASDGKDGRDGIDGRDGQNDPEHPAIVPQLRIDSDTRHWEISIDGGTTWTDTGIAADGRDGKDGQDGRDGRDGEPDIFMDITQAPDGNSISIVLRDGRTFVIPVVKEEQS
ncbi:MAG: hypothetical protein IJ569_01630 [Prevotella sp.]|nr:hypothetical protein [Prevotella sp.]